MRSYLIAALVLVCVWSAVPAHAQTRADADSAVEGLLKTLDASGTTEDARILRTVEGYVRFIAAPPGGHFQTQASAAKSSASPESVAKGFVVDHAAAFGVGSAKQQFASDRISSTDGRSYVRLQQTYNGFTVFGAQMLVQLDSTNAIVSISSDIMRDPGKLDTGELPLSPTITTAIAEANAIGFVAGLHEMDKGTLTSTDTTRMVLDPAVVGAPGELSVVMEVVVFSKEGAAIAERVFVNVLNGEIVFHYPLVHDVKHRTIYDANGIYPPPNTVVRDEGDGACGLQDADLAYDYFGDTYDFYYNNHNRDSIDGLGMKMRATVRYCEPGACPYENAFWLPQLPDGWSYYNGLMDGSMYFGEGYSSADDVIAHELTHGVTETSSDLVYAYQSGAINESFSDIWGEFVDLSNGSGNDSTAVRWMMGEDLVDLGAIRNMQDPTQFGDPDRVNSPYYYNGSYDNGGVHWNSGVINKLCYLLTDGDTFNGQTVTGMGIVKTAKLFYECQNNLLTSSSDFEDLYMALGQASVNLGYTFEERLNVRAAANAVEIAPLWMDEQVSHLRAIPAFTTRNRPVIALYWELPRTAGLRQVILVRGTTTYPTSPTEGLEVYRGLGEKFLDDTAISLGVTYYYALFADVTQGFPSAAYAKATAGAPPSDFVTEEFQDTGSALGNAFDLNYCQILFSPTGTPLSPVGAGSSMGDYDNYSCTVRRGVYDFPVSGEGSYNLSTTFEDAGYWVSPNESQRPFPFFQREYSQFFFSPNGYISFQPVSSYSNDNFPSYAGHFNVPRISYLFTDLAPKTGGTIWAKDMADRFVITVNYMPEWSNYIYPPATAPNSVQLEMFYSGHIRITYGAVNAKTAIVGLSDGRGIPMNPADLFSNLKPISFSTDFSSISTSPLDLSIQPITPPQVAGGEVAEFDATASFPLGQGYPVLWAEWTRPGVPTFIDEGNGTGHFRWETTLEDYGEHTVRVYARLGTQLAYQDVRCWVNIDRPLPRAVDLGIRTNNSVEDPTRSRIVSDDTELTAQYTYMHPLQYILPDLHAEGATQILWFQNQQFVYNLSNQLTVPPNYTRPNDQWSFKILPVALNGEEGPYAASPVVTVLALPEILNVVRVEDLPGNVLTEQLPLPGAPQAYGLSTGGTSVAILGNKLSKVTSVMVGGVQAASVRCVSDSRVDIVSPAHQPSPVVSGQPVPETLIVTTTAGTSSYANAFVYLNAGTVISKADVNSDGAVDAVDLQLVINAVLNASKNAVDADVNKDGRTNSVDIQVVINEALKI